MMFLSIKCHNLSAPDKSESKGNWETEGHKCLPHAVGRALSCPLSNSVMCWIVLGSVGLGWVELYGVPLWCIELCLVVLSSVELSCVGLGRDWLC